MEAVDLVAGVLARQIGLGRRVILHSLLILEGVHLERLPSLRREHHRPFVRLRHEVVVVPELDHVPALLGLLVA